MDQFDKTMKFSVDERKEENVKNVLTNVYNTLEERGYNPINQIVGYLQSGDPAYIPRHNEARNQIRHIERDEIMEILVKNYVDKEING
ncbi:IreB family regulatory phosphoprotein [Jeotgalicoccus huakuii]|uniref:IreB family regulatory phosphoprotein n=1 Tax=Jeotgalicoccus marinus TaxID=516700 RepID=UPI0004167BE2|nr:IreB family regulatory phosphoprotein [Jeotgalicoccus marinus]MCK1977478.1 IreB family regulatory phosphoprotein [Jeotgalicoccus huakuii]